MSEDRTLEVLELIHTIQAKNRLCIDQLNAKLAANPDSTHIELKSEGVANLVFLLETQGKFLTTIMEENQTIRDQLDALLRKFNL